MNCLNQALTKLNKHGENAGFPYVLFSLYQILYYIFIYSAWTWQAKQHIYPIWHLEVISFTIFILLALKKYWFSFTKKYYTLFWYMAVIWALPFSNTVSLLRYHNNNIDTVINCIFALFILALIVDWLSFSIILVLGVCFGLLSHYIIYHTIYIGSTKLVTVLGNCGWVIFICLLFSHKTIYMHRNLQLKKQLATIKTICANITHELRTPLLAIKSGAIGLSLYLPKLIDSYYIATTKELDIPKLHPRTLKHIEEVLINIESEVNSSNTIIDTLLSKVNQNADNPNIVPKYNIKTCVESAILRFPFSSLEDINLIHFNKNQDFYYQGDELLVIYIIFNLLDKTLYSAPLENKGKIYIWFAHNNQFNCLHFKSTVKNLTYDKKEQLFSYSYANKKNTTNIDLTFVKVAMTSLKGDISVESVQGKYTELILRFPNISNKKFT